MVKKFCRISYFFMECLKRIALIFFQFEVLDGTFRTKRQTSVHEIFFSSAKRFSFIYFPAFFKIFNTGVCQLHKRTVH